MKISYENFRGEENELNSLEMYSRIQVTWWERKAVADTTMQLSTNMEIIGPVADRLKKRNEYVMDAVYIEHLVEACISTTNVEIRTES